jgi:hypothetical protein
VKIAWHFAYILGFALNLGGVFCSLLAYTRTFKLHGKTEIFPRLSAFRRRVHRFFARFLPFLRKDTVLRPGVGEIVIVGDDVRLTADVTVSIPEDWPLIDQIRAAIRTIQGLRGGLVSEREARTNAIAGLDRRLGELSGRFTADVDRLDAKLYDVGVDSLRLQILGVALVIVGTTLLTGLGLFPPNSNATVSTVSSASSGTAALNIVTEGGPMDWLTFTANMIGSVSSAWPLALFAGLIIFRKQLTAMMSAITKMMPRIVRIRFRDLEVEAAAPQEVGEQEMSALISILLRSPHSFQWFRDNTEFEYTDDQFWTLIAQHSKVLEKVTIVSRDKDKRKAEPGLPGMRLTRTYRETIAAAAKTG